MKILPSLTTTTPLSNSSPLSSIPPKPCRVPVLWHSSSSSQDRATSGSRLKYSGFNFCTICIFGRTRIANLPAITRARLGVDAGASAIYGANAKYPRISFLISAGPVAAKYSVSAPPMEWPIRKSGIDSSRESGMID